MALSMKTEFCLLSIHLPSTPEYVSLAERVLLLLKICLSLVCQLQLQFSPHPQGPPQWQWDFLRSGITSVPSSISQGSPFKPLLCLIHLKDLLFLAV